MKKKRLSAPRHPTEAINTFPTHTHSLVSVGKVERQILGYLVETKGKRFNIKLFSRVSSVPRSSVYDAIDSLLRKGLISKPHYGNYVITQKGEHSLELLSGNTKSVRGECRDSGVSNLSTHYLKFKVNIVDRTNFLPSRLNELLPLRSGENKLSNLHQYFLYFGDATLIINPKIVILRVHDIVSDDTDESQIKSLSIAIDYVQKLGGIGLVLDSLVLEDAHYARINSLLSDYLERVDDRYFLDLGQGKKLWIDHSGGKREDETNDLLLRKRLDEFLDDALKSDALISDLDKMREVVGTLVKLRLLDSKLSLPKPDSLVDDDDPSLRNYFG